MSLAEVASHLFTQATAKLRREILGIVIAAVCAVGALVQGASAGVAALEPYIGLALAHLCVTIAFLLIGGIALAIPRYLARRHQTAQQVAAGTALPRSLQMAAIIEALLFGFSLAQKPRENRK